MKYFEKYLGVILLFISIVIGLLTYDGYGISWDEPQQRTIGQISFDCINGGEKAQLNLKYFNDNDYGVAFELPLIFIEVALNLHDFRDIYLARHLTTHLFFLLSAFFCFLLIDFLYKNKLLAALGFLIYILNPCIYGHSFFNSKDIPFMAMFLICFYISAHAFYKKEYKYFILLGICTGLLINMRIMGILMFCIVLLFLIFDFFTQKDNAKIKYIYFSLIFSIFTLFTLYLSWPYLWSNPFENFATAFNNMSKFRWDGSVLFNGEMVKGTKINWYYCLVWFGISNPILYVGVGVFGIIILIINFCKKPYNYISNQLSRNNIFYIICFISPIVAIIIFKSVLYDGWRQLYFLYPSFVLLIIYGINFLLKLKNKIKVFLLSSFLISFCWIIYFMVSNFPIYHVYFNQIVSTSKPDFIRQQYEMDYWGTAFKQSLEYLVKKDTSAIIPIIIDNYPGIYNRMILKPEERRRIKYVDWNSAKYFITCYRWHPQNYPEQEKIEFHSIKILNNSINTIFKINQAK